VSPRELTAHRRQNIRGENMGRPTIKYRIVCMDDARNIGDFIEIMDIENVPTYEELIRTPWGRAFVNKYPYIKRHEGKNEHGKPYRGISIMPWEKEETHLDIGMIIPEGSFFMKVLMIKLAWRRLMYLKETCEGKDMDNINTMTI
jgi:hypothetical protein